MQVKVNINDLTFFFNEIENKYNLFELENEEIYFWKIIRIPLWLIIGQETNLLQSIPNSRKGGYIKKFIDYLEREYITFKYNIIREKENFDIVIFESPRKIKIDNKNIDIHTCSIKNIISDKIKSLKYLEIDVLDTNIFKQENAKLALNSLVGQKIYSKYSKLTFTKKNIEVLNKISKEISERFLISIDVASLAKLHVLNFKYKYKYYNKMFNILKPKKIILICSYGNESLIAAAHSNDVIVAELQHGTISKHHLGYNFPSSQRVRYLPNILFLYGDYWRKEINMKLKSNNIAVIGNKYLRTQIEKFARIKVEKNSVVFLSQWTITDQLSEVAINFAEKNSDFKVIFKLHPREFSNWKENYPNLRKAASLSNFEVLDNSDIELHYLLSSCEYQVGVYSTAIYEGIALGCKTILISLPGIEYMENLINENYVKIANDDITLFDKMIDYDCYRIDMDYIFGNSKISKENLEGFLYD